jgi:tetratricopeptide (TPR) repeat protein
VTLRALALAPGNARVLRDTGTFAVYVARTEAGIAAVRHVVELDPLNSDRRGSLGWAFYCGRQYKKAIAAYQDALALDPEAPWGLASRGVCLLRLGRRLREGECVESFGLIA